MSTPIAYLVLGTWMLASLVAYGRTQDCDLGQHPRWFIVAAAPFMAVDNAVQLALLGPSVIRPLCRNTP